MRTIHNDTVKSTLLDLIPPNKRHRSSPVIITDNLDTIFMGFGDLIVKELRLVVLDLNSHSAYLNFILHYISINIERGDNGRALAESDLVSLDLRFRRDTLNKHSCRLARHYNI